MDRLRVRIYRCSLALSLAVTLGMASWLGLVLLGGPTGSAALMTPDPQTLKARSLLELAQARSKRQERASRSRRPVEPDEAHPEPPKDSEPAREPGTKAAPAAGEKASPTAKDEPAGAKAAAPDHQPPAEEPEPVEQVWSEAEIIAALEDCVRLLAPIAAHVEVSKPVRSGQCGAPAAVVVKRVGAATPVEISPPAVINCRMAARLHEWVEAILQPAARDLLDAPVTRLINASGYVCRNRNGAKEGRISEHAFANALDISAFVTADRRTVDVLTHWGKTERDLRAIALAKAEAEKQAKAEAAAAKAAEKGKGKTSPKEAPPSQEDSEKGKPEDKGSTKRGEAEGEPPERAARQGKGRSGGGRDQAAKAARSNLGGNPRPVEEARAEGEGEPVTREGTFLRRLHKGACGPFTTVLGPEANEAHRNHFHFDLAERRARRAFCE